MSAPRIEQAGSKGRFTLAEIRGFITKQKEREKSSPKKPETRTATPTFRGVKFPDLAKRSGTAPSIAKDHPSVSSARARLNLLEKL
jgi:hypothetical protein